MLTVRPRRNRRSPFLRDLVEETRLAPQDFVWPVFIKEGSNLKEEITTLPGVFRLSLDVLSEEISSLMELGLKAIALFPVIPDAQKNSTASEALNPQGFLPEALKVLKGRFPDLVLVTDVALDPYSSDGHDGLVENGKILNDKSLAVLAHMAVVQADAGADLVAPSDMMDGRVAAIRKALDDAGHEDVGILAYTAKYASSHYGPFREALASAPRFGDKKTYQMNPANAREALRELELDIQEGADIVMVKPAMAYLDIIYRLRERTTLPVAAYQVSGEYAQIEIAARAGALDRERAILESLTSIRRAGADIILSYYTPWVLRHLAKR
ncbi:MAG: porphobilinogen synthase [Bdellovibrionota bacterium]